MDDTEFILESFKNVQELIRFTDQKIGAILVLCGIEISVFLNILDSLNFSLRNISIIGFSTFLVGFIFIVTFIFIIYLSILKVLKPRFASSYKTKQYSLFYFEHISLNPKKKLHENIEKLKPNKKKELLADQLFEVSNILYRKNKYCSYIISILFFNVLFLVLYVFMATIV